MSFILKFVTSDWTSCYKHECCIISYLIFFSNMLIDHGGSDVKIKLLLLINLISVLPGTGRMEPVPINFRSGRSGLGEDTERKRKQEEMTKWRASMREKRLRKETEYQQDYRLQKSKMMAEKEAEYDLYKSQRVCEQLDEAQVLRTLKQIPFHASELVN